jgi:hypothetical protein
MWGTVVKHASLTSVIGKLMLVGWGKYTFYGVKW